MCRQNFKCNTLNSLCFQIKNLQNQTLRSISQEHIILQVHYQPFNSFNERVGGFADGLQRLWLYLIACQLAYYFLCKNNLSFREKAGMTVISKEIIVLLFFGIC